MKLNPNLKKHQKFVEGVTVRSVVYEEREKSTNF